ncbi:hypothetical protein KUTeg_016842 [Tegillarca granosa]|uniref:Helicase C-terminal domain-containing protein n=1 Tax=Tegillarca granosa TaxID=220873 RepID=A0ABQ9ERV3_TEGGR|nr:hypothetical protein KUTeg_016842 [Tegillarca granosa]
MQLMILPSLQVLQGLLKIFNKDHSKVLIFSYSTKILDILEQYMMTTGYEYRRLDGSTSIEEKNHHCQRI